MKATIYHNPKCSKSREALALLQEAGADVTIIEYLKTPPSRAELVRLYERAGMTPRQGLRMAEDGAKAVKHGDAEAILDAMMIDPLLIEPGVRVRYVRDRAGLGHPDLVVLPGSKATVADLAWLRARGLADEISTRDTTVLGICWGYQVMGRSIDDPVESGAGVVDGLGWLPR